MFVYKSTMHTTYISHPSLHIEKIDSVPYLVRHKADVYRIPQNQVRIQTKICSRYTVTRRQYSTRYDSHMQQFATAIRTSTLNRVALNLRTLVFAHGSEDKWIS